VVVQTADGNVAIASRLDDRIRAGSEQVLRGHFPQPLDCRVYVEREILRGGHDQLASRSEAGPGQFLLTEPEDDLENALFGGLTSAAKANSNACKCL
jgi:hypothetical protein